MVALQGKQQQYFCLVPGKMEKLLHHPMLQCHFMEIHLPYHLLTAHGEGSGKIHFPIPNGGSTCGFMKWKIYGDRRNLCGFALALGPLWPRTTTWGKYIVPLRVKPDVHFNDEWSREFLSKPVYAMCSMDGEKWE